MISRSTIFAATLVAVLGGALALGRAPSSSALLDLTGDWTYVISGDFEGSCEVTLVQTGEAISGSFDCPGGAEDGILEGAVTQQGDTTILDSTVTLYAGSIVLDIWETYAEVFPAGNNITGSWESGSNDSGTFAGTRHVPIYIKGDLNCDGEVDGADVLSGMLWSLDFDPLQEPFCPEIGADLGVIFGDIDCSEAPDLGDGLPLLRYVADLPVDLGQGCLTIGSTYSPVIPT